MEGPAGLQIEAGVVPVGWRHCRADPRQREAHVRARVIHRVRPLAVQNTHTG